MGQTTDTRTFTDIVSHTLDNTRETVVDNIFKQNSFYAKMNLNGKKELTSGGTNIDRTVEYAENSTVTSFNGYDVVPVVPQETFTDCQYTWKELAGNIVASRRESRLNSGAPQIRSLVKSKIKNLEKSMASKMNTMLLNPSGATFTAGNSGKDLLPLTEIISLSANTVGNISESANSWWAPQRQAAVATGAATQTLVGFKGELRSFYNTCGQTNEGFPDLCLAGKLAYEKYEEALEGQVRYGSTEMANLGFETIMLKGAEVCWDQIVPGTTDSGAAYAAYDTADEQNFFFLNTDYLYLVVDTETDMVDTPWVDHQSNGQFAKSKSVLFMGELIVTNRRTQGVLYGIQTTGISG